MQGPELPRKPQARAGVQSLQRVELNEPDRAGQLCTKLMALFCQGKLQSVSYEAAFNTTYCGTLGPDLLKHHMIAV